MMKSSGRRSNWPATAVANQYRGMVSRVAEEGMAPSPPRVAQVKGGAHNRPGQRVWVEGIKRGSDCTGV